jgi:hypothetical protein
VAKSNYGTVKAMAAKWGVSVRGIANIKRAEQTRFFKAVWLSNKSPFSLVTNVISTDLDKKQADMKVSAALVESGLTTVEDVRDCLKSEDMYLNPALYNLLCCGLESGKLKNGKKQGPSTLRCLITVAHEAHIRLELYLALKRQRYHKNSNATKSAARKLQWEALCETVFKDRLENAEAAELARREGHGLGNAALDEVDSDEEPKSLVDPKYF